MNRITKILSLAIAVLALMFTSCEGPNVRPCVNGKGSRVVKTYDVQNFKEIELNIPATLYLSENAQFSVEIEAQQNILDELALKLTGDRLEITSDRCLKSFETVEVRIGLPEIVYLELAGSGKIIGQDRFTSDQLTLRLSGSGDIEFEADADMLYNRISGSGKITVDAASDAIDSKISGSGDLYLTGTSNTHTIQITGSGSVKAFEANTNDCDVEIIGSGNVEVNVLDNLDVNITGSGNVSYKGNPALTLKVTGSGRVTDAN